jgi:hypothetical protein
MRHNDGVACVVRAAVTIHKGEEVTDNYGHFFQVSRHHECRLFCLNLDLWKHGLEVITKVPA